MSCTWNMYTTTDGARPKIARCEETPLTRVRPACKRQRRQYSRVQDLPPQSTEIITFHPHPRDIPCPPVCCALSPPLPRYATRYIPRFYPPRLPHLGRLTQLSTRARPPVPAPATICAAVAGPEMSPPLPLRPRHRRFRLQSMGPRRRREWRMQAPTLTMSPRSPRCAGGCRQALTAGRSARACAGGQESEARACTWAAHHVQRR
mmetsp:Transcript_33778/g.89448  ORF Transcript_33778/g.89448 Transcript_33778/m.89448 type:complete len:205 (-) Transcript_33778:225-839(-)